jgi:DNA repair exonuclease SbcCD ATPase subunit
MRLSILKSRSGKLALIFSMVAAIILLVATLGLSNPLRPALADLKSKAVERLHRIGNRMIDRRIFVLNRLKNRAEHAVRVDENGRNEVIAELDSEISSLSSLKDTINQDSDIDSLKNEIHSIINDHRTFMVILPRNRGRLAVARLNFVTSKLDEISTKIQELIDKLSGKGFDTAPTVEAFNQFKADLDSLKTYISQASSNFQSMSISDVDGARDLLKQGKDNLRHARKQLATIRQDIHKIIFSIRLLHKTH